jgi:hypothetical protein
MTTPPVVVTSLMALAIVGVSSPLCAQASKTTALLNHEVEGVDTGALKDQKLKELSEWLRRLVGRYRVVDVATHLDGLLQLRGSGDCVAVGTGPGVHCIIDVVLPNGESLLSFPRVFLFGITPEAPGFKYMMIDERSRPDSATGSLKADMAYFRVRCPGIPGEWLDIVACRRDVRIRAPLSGQLVELWIDTYERPSISSEELHRMEHYELIRRPIEGED